MAEHGAVDSRSNDARSLGRASQRRHPGDELSAGVANGHESPRHCAPPREWNRPASRGGAAQRRRVSRPSNASAMPWQPLSVSPTSPCAAGDRRFGPWPWRRSDQVSRRASASRTQPEHRHARHLRHHSSRGARAASDLSSRAAANTGDHVHQRVEDGADRPEQHQLRRQRFAGRHELRQECGKNSAVFVQRFHQDNSKKARRAPCDATCVLASIAIASSFRKQQTNAQRIDQAGGANGTSLELNASAGAPRSRQTKRCSEHMQHATTPVPGGRTPASPSARPATVRATT